MARETSPAYQQYPRDYLSDENVQLMTIEEEGCYRRLMDYCWLEGSIPANGELLAKLCKGTVPSNLVLSCFDHPCKDSSRLMHPRLEVERRRQAEWRKKCSIGGKKSAHKPKHRKKQSTEQGSNTILPLNEQGSDTLHSHSLSHIASSEVSLENLENSSQASVSSEKPKTERPKDEAYELWASEFMEHRGVPYQDKRGDFIRLANLRKKFGLNGKGIPDKWPDSIHNYLASPLTKFTLADLCERYDIFFHGEVNEYGRPLDHDGQHQKNQSTFRKFTDRGLFGGTK